MKGDVWTDRYRRNSKHLHPALLKEDWRTRTSRSLILDMISGDRRSLNCFRNIRGRGPALNDHGAREESRTFESWGIWTTSKANVTVLAQPEQVHTILIPAAYLRPLGVLPVAGRKLTAADQDQGGKSENGPLRQIESTT